MPFSNAPYYNCRMSQYGSNHSHYQTTSSVASDKPWDIVAAAAAAAAANVGHNIKTSVGAFPNGFQATVVNGSGAELPSGGNVSGYFNAGQNPNHHSPSWASEARRLYASGQQQQWANVAGEQYHQRHSSTHHSQQYHQHHVLQQQTQLSAASSNAPSSAYFASARLTSPASSPTGWPKLPHQSLIHAINDDDSSSSQQLKFEPRHHYPPQQSPTYLSRSVDAHSSYNSLLAASAGLNQLPPNQHLRHQNYQPSNNAVYQQQGRVPDVRQNAPLYHSSLELEMLRTFAAANSCKKPDRENASLMNFSPPQRQPNYLHPSPSASPRSAALSAYLTANHSGNIKSEPCLSPRLNSSEMEAVKTMLSIQTNLVKENSLAGCEYQQISPAASDDSATDELRLNCGYDNSLAKPSSFQISRDEARAQQNTVVPAIDVALVNNNESSSISTSAKSTQEYKKTVATDKSDNRKDRLLPLHRSPLSKEVRADSVEETSKGEIDVENPAHNSYPSGISVVSKHCSVGASLPALGSPDPLNGNKGQQKLESECNSSDSSCSSPENRNASSSPSTVLGARLSPLSSMSSRSESTPSKSAISGYGLQHRNASGHGIVYNCHICKFSCLSKFHFNSHMNTHADHKCTFCDYTSRTEGRLKRHMKDFHTHSTDAEDYGGKLIIHEGDDSNRCSPPSPDENTALIEREVMAVVSAVTNQSSEGHSPSGSQSNKQTTSNKPKNYRCKQCTFVATSKTEFWLHQKSAHIKGDRVLSCSRCLFVTEYKHHLEYHLRNHFGSKPFKCTKCNYSCVNKSMLNSHMKSHSNFYQYRCDDCTYATKYCHSLKMHLRKYAHRPASVINPDGSTSEPSVIDVYGNRRGPRTRKNHGASQGTPPVSSSVPSITALLPPMTVPPVLNGVGGMSSGGPSSLTPLMEALQTSYLKQQQELATAMATSIATLGAQLPTVPSSMPMNDSNLIDDGMPMLPTSSALRCNMCNFETNDGKDVLTVHVMTHIIKKDLCNLYNLESTTVAASASTNSNSSTPNERLNNGYSQTVESTLGRVSSSTPKDEARSRSSSFVAHFGQASSNSPTARISPSQEISQDSNSPASASYGKHSGDESVSGVEAMPHSSRRKGKAYKLDKIALRLQERVSPMTPSSKEDEAELLDATDNALPAASQHSSSSSPSNKRQHSPVAVSCPKRLNSHASNASASNTTAIVEAESEAVFAHCNHTAEPTDIDWSNAYVCNYCEIAFKDCIMYTIHMGYHGFRDPFKCNMCGHVSDGRLSMFLHIARVPHP